MTSSHLLSPFFCSYIFCTLSLVHSYYSLCSSLFLSLSLLLFLFYNSFLCFFVVFYLFVFFLVTLVFFSTVQYLSTICNVILDYMFSSLWCYPRPPQSFFRSFFYYAMFFYIASWTYDLHPILFCCLPLFSREFNLSNLPKRLDAAILNFSISIAKPVKVFLNIYRPTKKPEKILKVLILVQTVLKWCTILYWIAQMCSVIIWYYHRY